MEVEVVREEIKEYVVRFSPAEYHDLMVLFSASDDVLWGAFTEGALAGTVGSCTNDRKRFTNNMRDFVRAYVQGRKK